MVRNTRKTPVTEILSKDVVQLGHRLAAAERALADYRAATDHELQRQREIIFALDLKIVDLELAERERSPDKA